MTVKYMKPIDTDLMQRNNCRAGFRQAKTSRLTLEVTIKKVQLREKNEKCIMNEWRDMEGRKAAEANSLSLTLPLILTFFMEY